jgi:salicylate hydroxylase
VSVANCPCQRHVTVITARDALTELAIPVIGCDGIKSRVRPWVVGAEHPACQAQYTHKVAYRGLVPMDQAIRALGEWTAHNFHHHVGPGAHVTHYPVANHTALNTTVFLSDAEEWPDSKSMVAEGGRDEVLAALHDWHPNVLALVGLLPASLIRWALFDQHEYPVPRYYKGRVCIAGDAAHASSPHHGAGACAGVEDALCLCTLFDDQQKLPEDSDPRSLDAVCASFDALRRTRTQWLVNSSRRACDLYHQPEWADPTRWAKAETCFEELRDRSYKIWDFDADTMVADTRAEYQKAISELSVPLSIPGSHRGARGQSDRQVEVGLANL